jgi:hypothetical protein
MVTNRQGWSGLEQDREVDIMKMKNMKKITLCKYFQISILITSELTPRLPTKQFRGS